MASFRKHCPLDLIYLARVGALRAEDCGPCLQLMIKFAVTEGLKPELFDWALNDTSRLSSAQKLAYDLGYEVAQNRGQEPSFVAEGNKLWGDKVMAEIAVAIATARVYPAIKRSLGVAQSCQLVEPLNLDSKHNGR